MRRYPDQVARTHFSGTRIPDHSVLRDAPPRLTVAVCAGFGEHSHPWEVLKNAGLTEYTVVDLRHAPTQLPTAATCPAPGTRVSTMRSAARRAQAVASVCGHPRVVLIPDPADPLPGEWAGHLARLTPDSIHFSDVSALATHLGKPRNNLARELASTSAHSLAALVGATRALLVEGSTDRALFSVLLRRWGLLTSTAVAANSKVRLAGLYALSAQLGVPTYVVFDGDGGAAQTPGSKAHHVQRTRHIQSAALTSALPSPDGQATWTCGDPGSVGPQWCVWEENLEAELAQWPSFVSALKSTGATLGAKDPKALATAAEQARLSDLPEQFSQLEVVLRQLADP